MENETDLDREMQRFFAEATRLTLDLQSHPGQGFAAALEVALEDRGVEHVEHIVTHLELKVGETLTPSKAKFYAEKMADLVVLIQKSNAYRNSSRAVQKFMMRGLEFSYDG